AVPATIALGMIFLIFIVLLLFSRSPFVPLFLWDAREIMEGRAFRQLATSRKLFVSPARVHHGREIAAHLFSVARVEEFHGIKIVGQDAAILQMQREAAIIPARLNHAGIRCLHVSAL